MVPIFKMNLEAKENFMKILLVASPRVQYFVCEYNVLTVVLRENLSNMSKENL